MWRFRQTASTVHERGLSRSPRGVATNGSLVELHYAATPLMFSRPVSIRSKTSITCIRNDH